ncbi:MAG: MFS transporter [Actinomycetales bacterium]|nr:MFS transporter [Actinomycetales bacterium]
MRAIFRSLAIVNYRLWFLGATVSNIGTWMQRTAQDWIVLTRLTDNDAAAVGVTMALQFGPALVLTPLTGLVSDVFDRRRILLVTQSALAALGLGLGILTVTGVVELWMVMAFALALGIVSAFDAPARQTFVGSLVPPALLSNAVGLNATSFNTARLIGPAVAGLLTELVGAGWVFLLNTLTFAATIGVLLAMHRDELVVQERAPRQPGRMVAGFAYVRRRPDILLVFGMVALLGTLGMNFPIFVSTMAVQFGTGAGGFGLLTSVMAVGSLVGALLSARRERPRLTVIAIAAAVFGVALGVAAWAPNVWIFGALLAIVGVASISMLNSSNAYVQTSTPPSVRGRVMSLYMAIFVGGTLVGAPLVGWVANTAGPRWSIVLGAASALAAAMLALVYWLRIRAVRLHWDRARRWPLRVSYGDPRRARELATAEIAVIETETQR